MNDTPNMLLIYLPLAIVVGGFVLMVTRKLTKHEVNLDTILTSQATIIDKIDDLGEIKQDIAVIKNDVITLYKQNERDRQNVN